MLKDKKLEAPGSFATEIARRGSSEDQRDQIYSTAALGLLDASHPINLSDRGFSIERLHKGAESLRKRFPDSGIHEQFAALLACYDHDRAAAKNLFDRVGPIGLPMIWGLGKAYHECQRRILTDIPAQVVQTIDVGWQPIVALDAVADGSTILVGTTAERSGLAIYSTDTGKKVFNVPFEDKLRMRTIDPAGKTVGLATKRESDSVVQFWDVAKAERILWHEYQNDFQTFMFSPAGDMVVLSDETIFKLFNRPLKPGPIAFRRLRPSPLKICAAFAPNQSFLAASANQSVNLIDLNDQSKSRRIFPNLKIDGRVAASDNFVILAAFGESLWLYDVKGKPKWNYRNRKTSSVRHLH